MISPITGQVVQPSASQYPLDAFRTLTQSGGSGTVQTSQQPGTPSSINDALGSTDEDVKLEGQAARDLQSAGINIVDFKRKIGPGGALGEIDVQTKSIFVKVVSRTSGKAGQIRNYIEHVNRNPTGRRVILYAPEYNDTPARDIIDAGAYLARTPEQLIALARLLGV